MFNENNFQNNGADNVELIKVNYENDRMTTSARALWDGLNKPYDKFTKWFNTYKEFGFVENEDYREVCTKIHTSNNAEHDAVDYEITLEMAKQLAMLQKTPEGARYRQYFIELEKRWNSPEFVMKRALEMATARCKQLENKAKQLEEVVNTKQTTIDILTKQLLTLGDRTLFNVLVKDRVIDKYDREAYRATYNEVYALIKYQCSIDVKTRANNRNCAKIDTVSEKEWPFVVPVIVAWYLQKGGSEEYLKELVKG